jgi:photosystem II stability/assembly factor-like uncharacterized protein
MVRTRSIWFACITLGVLLMLLAAGRASAKPLEGGPALPGPAHAWVWQNPLPQGNALSTVAVVGDHIVTAGETQAVYSSSDGGATWRAFDLDTNQTIPAVILDRSEGGSEGWLVFGNDYGASFQSECWGTDDSGATWVKLSEFEENRPVDCLYQLDDDTLYAGGYSGYVVVSDDGGETWRDISVPMDEHYTADVASVCFIDAKRGWAATPRILYGTQDGGATWEPLKEFDPSDEDKFFPRISCVTAPLVTDADEDDVKVYMTTLLGGAYQSADAGRNWEKLDLGGVKTTFSVSFLTPARGIVTGGAGHVWTTEDSGETWDAAGLPLDFNVLSAAWNPADADIVACGAGGMLARSRDAGMTWVRIGSGRPWTLFGAVFKDQETGWVVGESGYIAATKDGRTWVRQRSAKDGRPSLDDVAFPTYRRGCAVGDKGTVLTTRNGGDTWTQVPSGTRANLSGVAFSDAAHGWAVGSVRSGETVRGVILRTRDGGAHWRAQRVPSGVQTLSKVRFIDDRTGWAVGSPGIVLRTTDGGATWKRTLLARDSNLLDVEFVDRRYGWVCGSAKYGGDLGYRTTDGGVTWIRESIPADAIQAVDFTDRKHGWQVGMSGLVIATSDGGVTWRVLPQSAPASYLFGLRMWGDGTGFVAGQFGTIMKTETGGQGLQ